MAQTTELSNSALPGKVHVFAAKTAFIAPADSPGGVNVTVTTGNTVSVTIAANNRVAVEVKPEE